MSKANLINTKQINLMQLLLEICYQKLLNGNSGLRHASRHTECMILYLVSVCRPSGWQSASRYRDTSDQPV